MRAIYFGIVALFIALGVSSGVDAGQTRVRPSVRRNGSYVQPHARTSPNRTKADNWSTKGNVNPYTGKKGTRNPW